jgi:hypothetical protein
MLSACLIYVVGTCNGGKLVETIKVSRSRVASVNVRIYGALTPETGRARQSLRPRLAAADSTRFCRFA